VRQESEAFVAALNAAETGGSVATLVRISEDYPLPERSEKEGLAPTAVIPILMTAAGALEAIDGELKQLAVDRGSLAGSLMWVHYHYQSSRTAQKRTQGATGVVVRRDPQKTHLGGAL
jgi:hypothetical protein